MPAREGKFGKPDIKTAWKILSTGGKFCGPQGLFRMDAEGELWPVRDAVRSGCSGFVWADVCGQSENP
jgi:hypothetical protein